MSASVQRFALRGGAGQKQARCQAGFPMFNSPGAMQNHRLNAAANANARLWNEDGSRIARLAVHDDAFAVVHA